MSNTNTKGRLIFMGGMVHATLNISSDWEMPYIHIHKNPSYANCIAASKAKSNGANKQRHILTFDQSRQYTSIVYGVSSKSTN